MVWARFPICTNLVGCSTVDLGISKKDPHTQSKKKKNSEKNKWMFSDNYYL